MNNLNAEKTINEKDRTNYKKGHIIEKTVRDYIIKKTGCKLLMVQDSNNYKYIKYDFETDDGNKYEVKYDAQAQRTGNFFIEYMQNFQGVKCPTCIKNTDSNKWIIAINKNEYYELNTADLFDIINTIEYNREHKIKNIWHKDIFIKDTYHTTHGYLIKVDELKKIAIHHINKDA